MPFQEGGDSVTDRRLHGLPFAGSVDNGHFRAFGSGSEKALANGFQVGCALGFDAVWFSLNPFDCRFNWHVQQQGQVRLETSGSDVPHLPNVVDFEASSVALVDHSRQQKSVADHRLAGVECRLDDFFNKLRPSSHKQEHFTAPMNWQIACQQ